MKVEAISLQELVNRLISADPLASSYCNMVRNDIPADLMIHADENMLAYVLWNLISSAVNNIHDECICIEALSMEDRTIIRIKDVGTYFYHTISQEYRKVQYVAEKLGGSVSIDHDTHYGANASFIISNRLLVA
jgi:C4-dicarboxylate-specific signal transduction histidine kinase